MGDTNASDAPKDADKSFIMAATDTARRRPGGSPGAAGASSSASTSRSTSPESLTSEEIEATIAKLPSWIDQLGGIRSLIIGGLGAVGEKL